MNLNNVFDDFCESLKVRTEDMAEDTIRYYWYSSMAKQDGDLNKYILEEQYGVSSTIMHPCELDLHYKNNESLLFEIKFHRKTSSTFAHTDAAGSIFGDLLRLLHHPTNPARRLFLYVTDSEMDKYLSKGGNAYRNTLKEFYQLGIGVSKSLNFTTPPKTFLASAYKSFVLTKSYLTTPTITIKLISKWDYIPKSCSSFALNECHVRLYEVINGEKLEERAE